MEPVFDARWTVEQLMRAYPQTVPVFLSLRMDCPGCQLERFCTLEEAAQSYDLSLDVLLGKLNGSIQISTLRGE